MTFIVTLMSLWHEHFIPTLSTILLRWNLKPKGQQTASGELFQKKQAKTNKQKADSYRCHSVYLLLNATPGKNVWEFQQCQGHL